MKNRTNYYEIYRNDTCNTIIVSGISNYRSKITESSFGIPGVTVNIPLGVFSLENIEVYLDHREIGSPFFLLSDDLENCKFSQYNHDLSSIFRRELVHCLPYYKFTHMLVFDNRKAPRKFVAKCSKFECTVRLQPTENISAAFQYEVKKFNNLERDVELIRNSLLENVKFEEGCST